MGFGEEVLEEAGAADLQKVGPYQLVAPLGAGGMGQVFRAFDGRLRRDVAIKKIRSGSADNPKARRRFLREARAAARLRHPNIIKVHDILCGDEGDWMVMELVEGPTLARVLEGGALPAEQVVPIGMAVAKALEAAHAENIVHRDLKLQNILLGDSEQPKILDFGLAKWIDGSARTSLTLDGQIVGTPHTMSPEQAMGRTVDFRSDLFSLGSLLHELLVGEAPFRGRTPLDSLRRVCADRPRPLHEILPGVPRPLSDLVSRLLEKDPSHRPRSASEVVLELSRVPEPRGVAEPQSVAGGTGTLAETSDGTLDGATLGPSRGVNERRQVTVVSCELTTGRPSGSLDPVKDYQVSTRFERLVAEAVRELDGHVVNRLGHRAVACFGYPRAHEDDVQRAVRCALGLVEGVSDLRDGGGGDGPSVRIGLHTGRAVVLQSEGWEQLVLGTTIEVAEELRRRAEPDRVAVSGATRKLIVGGADLEPLEGPSGEPAEIDAYQILAVRPTSSGTWGDAATLSPLMARDQELELLRSRFRRVAGGTGQVVLVSGEAGIGKSRLVQEVRDELETDGVRWCGAQCSQRLLGTPLVPMFEVVRDLLGINTEEGPQEQAEQVGRGLARLGLEARDLLPLLAQGLGLPLPEGTEAPDRNPREQRRLTFEALGQILATSSQGDPMGLLIEDLHWADPSTLEFLGRLLSGLESQKIFLLLTFRPEFSPPWNLSEHRRIDLNRLPSGAVETLVDQITGGKPLPEGVRQRILERTDGVPLFVEELTRYLLDSEQLVERADRWELAGSPEELEIPATLRDSLTARLDGLGSARSVAQLASVIGREFSRRLLDAICDLDVEVLERDLECLIDARLVRRRGFGSRSRYLFRHALIQDAAYDSLLKGQRRGFHRRIAQTLESSFPEVASHRPEQLAHHWTKADEAEPAVVYWHKAGGSALERSANQEAARHFEKGLGLVDGLADLEQRTRLELALQNGLGVSVQALESWSSVEVGRAFERAAELSGDSASNVDLFTASFGRMGHHLTRGEYALAHEIAQGLFEHTQERPIFLAQALYGLGFIESSLGEVSVARGRLEEAAGYLQGMKLGQPVGLESSGSDLRVGINAQRSLVLWQCGEHEEALEAAQEVVDYARTISHSLSLCIALGALCTIRFLQRERAEVRRVAEELLEVCQRDGQILAPQAAIYLGWSQVAAPSGSGEVSDDTAAMEGLDRIREGLADRAESGDRLHETLFLVVAADAHRRCGRHTQAVEFLERASAFVEETGENLWIGEVHRMRAEMALGPTGPTTRGSKTDVADLESSGTIPSRGPTRKQVDQVVAFPSESQVVASEEYVASEECRDRVVGL